MTKQEFYKLQNLRDRIAAPETQSVILNQELKAILVKHFAEHDRLAEEYQRVVDDIDEREVENLMDMSI